MEILIAKHRGTGNGDAAYDETYRPRHCAGDGCLHNHAGASVPLRGVMRFFAPWARKSVA